MPEERRDNFGGVTHTKQKFNKKEKSLMKIMKKTH